jgi:YHS domain-containing protein
MFRLIFYLLGLVFVITLIRGVIGVLGRAFSALVAPPPLPRETSKPEIPLSGELKKDPACGTYISAATSIKRTVDGETYHFCSAECRDKFVAALTR